MIQQNLSPLKSARRAKIVMLVEPAFAKQGFRAATMEGLAEAAHVSKATFYGYFPDKEAAFQAVAQNIATDIENAFTTALSGSKDLEQKVTAALIAKHQEVHSRVRQSPFAAELFSAKSQTSAAIFEALDDAIELRLVKTLASSGYSKTAARQLARLLLSASQGIANHNTDFALTRKDITKLTKSLI